MYAQLASCYDEAQRAGIVASCNNDINALIRTTITYNVYDVLIDKKYLNDEELQTYKEYAPQILSLINNYFNNTNG